MIPDTVQPSARRIAITLEASEAGRPVLEACARLAALLGAELEGIFIEDSDLIRLAGLSFLRELRPVSLGEEALSTLRMQRELRTLARHAERMLEQAARESGVPWSFRVWRGPAGAESLAGSLAAEFLGLVRTSRRAALRLWATSGMRMYPSQHRVTGVSAMFGDSVNAVRAMHTAAQLAHALSVPLTLLAANGVALPDLLSQQLEVLLAGQPLHVRLRPATGDALHSLTVAVTAAGAGILVAPADHPLFRASGLDPCLEALPCPVLLVR